MQTSKKAFTLVEMIVAMAVSTIIIAGAYASYDMVKTQYTKNLDLSQMQQSGRAIMQMIERDARMAGFEYLDEDANMTYGKISSPLVIKDSGNKCCDELTVIYDYVDDVLDWKGKLVSSSVNRIRVRYWTEAFTSKKGDRFRLYKQKDLLGKGNLMLANPIIGNKEVMADYIEDLQFVNITSSSSMYIGSQKYGALRSYNPASKEWGPQLRLENDGGTVINVMELDFGPDGKLWTGSYQYGNMRPYDPVNNEWGDSVSGGSQVRAMAFAPDELLYVASYSRGRPYINSYDPVSKKWGNEFQFSTTDPNWRRKTDIPATAVAVSPDGLLYFGSDYWGTVNSYDPVSKKWGQETQFKALWNTVLPVGAMAFSPDGLLYVGALNPHSTGGIVRVFDPASKTWGNQYIMFNNIIDVGNRGRGMPITAMAFGSDGLLYVGSWRFGVLRAYNPATKTWGEQHTFKDSRGVILPINSMAIKTKKTGLESLVTINLTLRTKERYGKDRQFSKKDYHAGNFELSKSDNYKRDTFSSKVLVRNMML